MRKAFWVATFLWVVCFFSDASSASLLTATVKTIGETLRNAKVGDTVALSPDTYAGPVRLPSGVSLDGRGAVLVTAADSEPAITMDGPCSLQNLTVTGFGGSDVGVRIIHGPVSFKNVHVRGFRKYGVRAGRNEGTFAEGSIEECGVDGLSAAGGKWTIKTSRFARNGDDGVDLFKCNSSNIVSNVFDGNGDAALELAISSDVRFIGNASRKNRVTCSVRLGDYPSRFSNNKISDTNYLEKRGEVPVTEIGSIVARYDATNIRIEGTAADGMTPTPVEIQQAQPMAPSPTSSTPSAPSSPPPGTDFAERVRTSAAKNLAYAGLQPSDLPMKGQTGVDSAVSAILRRTLDDPLSLGAWLGSRGRDADSPLTGRFRQFAADAGVTDIDTPETFTISPADPKEFAESFLRAWKIIDATYQKSFEGFDSAGRARLQSDLEAEYAEEPELGLPLAEDFLFDVEYDKTQSDIIRRANNVHLRELYGSAEKMMALLPDVARALSSLKSKLSAKESSKEIVYRRATPWGPLIIQGTGETKNDSVAGFVFDLGGDDQYAALNEESPSVIVDLAGNDAYGSNVAAGVDRLSAVMDMEGDDRYNGESRTQACGLLGVGILIDAAGSDRYDAGRYSQGFGFYGVGWLQDGGGDDVYRVNGYGQAFGAVRGLGVLADAGGNDRYEILPGNSDAIRDSSRTTSMGQGIGEGLRPNGFGGVGILWDGGGRDEYLADLFAQGIGYWYGFGALIDLGNSNDNYTAYHYVQGAGVHISVGALFDEGGADRYQAWYVAQGCGHDVSLGALYDVSGNDIYSSYGLSQGAGSTNGVGILCDGAGRDAYMGVARISGQGDAWYQARLREFGSIGLLFDLGGDDYYASGSLNRSVWFKGEYGLGVDE